MRLGRSASSAASKRTSSGWRPRRGVSCPRMPHAWSRKVRGLEPFTSPLASGAAGVEPTPTLKPSKPCRRLTPGWASTSRVQGVSCAPKATLSVSAARRKKLVAVALEDAGEGSQNAVGHPLHLFRVAQLDTLRAADEVEQQNADPAEAAAGLGGRGRRWGCGRLKLLRSARTGVRAGAPARRRPACRPAQRGAQGLTDIQRRSHPRPLKGVCHWVSSWRSARSSQLPCRAAPGAAHQRDATAAGAGVRG